MAASINAHDHAPHVLLDAYEGLLVHVTQMHELVSAEQWVELIEQRTHYVLLVEEVRKLDSVVVLDDPAKQRKAELLERILEYDVEIRRRLMARRDELGKLIGVSQRQRDLHRAYAPQQGASFSALGSDDGEAAK
ncbi:Flagellar biosynthesis protein FliT [Halomonas citrativorans]|uniref:Flagellar protein FliT n=1 Tax=Halomonas citrativorans TaxID=2742612 RepID=A0A1R4I241_9GAMM|nr:flagellar protein FliT [Halomonas citrativorans]SJN13674.1 Flagellar biosynthesis protein FliT [Halomonas citrativorans]